MSDEPGGDAAASPPGSVSAADKAIHRRRDLEPDILLGPLSMWVGTGDGQSWPWIDIAVRIGTGWENVVDLHGAMLQRPDLLAFGEAMRAFAQGERNDLLLGSLGGSMRLILRRSEYGSLHGEAWFNRGRLSQTAVFPLWDEAIAAAFPGVEATTRRLKDAQWGWKPSPEHSNAGPLLPRASGIDEYVDQDRPPNPPWNSGLGDGEDVSFHYEIDGYGWYSIGVRVGDSDGGFGGGYLTDPMGDLLRAGLALLAGANYAELTCNAEPALTRVEFERVLLSADDTAPRGARTRYGCRIRIRDIDDCTGESQNLTFDALCRSPRSVAEASYRMALPHFREGAGPWSDAMAALEGALASIPRDPD